MDMTEETGDLPEFDVDSNGLVSWAEAEELPLPTCSNGPSVPDIPDFVDQLNVRDIDSTVERHLALHLDIVNVASRVKSWQFLAERLGMPWEEINVSKRDFT